MLDAAIENFLHFRAARIGDDAAIAEGARTPLGAALEPAENFSVGDDRRAALHEFFFRQFGDGIAALRELAGGHRGADSLARVARPPISVVHHKGARLAENLVPYVEGGANGETGVPGRGMNIDFFERRRIEDFSVGHAIEGHAAGEANGFAVRLCGQFAQHTEVNFFEPRLQSGREIAMPLFEQSFGRARGPAKFLAHFPRKHLAESGGLVRLGPGHFRAGTMVREIFKGQLEAVGSRARVEGDNIAHGVELLRLAVRGETHDLVLVAEFQKTKILRDGAVEKSQRMRKGHGASDVQAVPRSRTPHGAREIAEAIGGKQRGVFKGRDEIAAGEMRLMVLDAMIFGGEFCGIAIEGGGQGLGNAGEFHEDFGAFTSEAGHAQGIPKLGRQTRVGIARNGDVMNFRRSQPGFRKAIADGGGRKSRSVFHAIEAFFFDGGD